MLIRSELHEEDVTKPIHKKALLRLAESSNSERQMDNRFTRRECDIVLVSVL